MADKRISDLSAASSLAGADLIEVEQGGISKKGTVQQVLDIVLSGVSASFDTLAEIATALGGKLTAANNLSDVASVDASRINLQLGFGMPQNRFYSFNDCIYKTVTSDHWVINFSGTSAQAVNVAVGSLNALGILNLDLGTTTTGRCSIGDINGASSNVKLGSGRARFQAKCAMHVLSTGTDTYTTRVGFIDSISGESTDGVFFRYTDGVNSGKWQAVCRSNGVETATDTGVAPVADTWHLMTIDVNAAGSSVAFTIDGSNLVTTTANIPTGAGRETGYGMMSLKSAGTTDTSGGYVDFLEVDYLFTAAR